MIDEEPCGDAHLISAVSMLQCLTMLAEEAENLGMARTALAIRKSLRACHAEQARPRSAVPRGRRYGVLH